MKVRFDAGVGGVPCLAAGAYHLPRRHPVSRRNIETVEMRITCGKPVRVANFDVLAKPSSPPRKRDPPRLGRQDRLSERGQDINAFVDTPPVSVGPKKAMPENVRTQADRVGFYFHRKRVAQLFSFEFLILVRKYKKRGGEKTEG